MPPFCVIIAETTSVPAVQDIFNYLLFAFSLFLLPRTEIVIFLAGRIVGVIKIVIIFFIAAVVITVAVVTVKRKRRVWIMYNINAL